MNRAADLTEKLFAIRTTVLEMMVDRGYIVSQAESGMDLAKFMTTYGKPPPLKALTLLFQKKEDSSENILVFWDDSDKVGVRPIKKYVEAMEETKVYRAILILRYGITSYARQAIQEIHPYRIEYFLEKELVVNITRHALVPKHELTSEHVKNLVITKYTKGDPQRLPRISVTDPVARYLGVAVGELLKITRPSETAGLYVTYRIVVSGEFF